MRKYRILELVITRDQTRNALHAPSRSLQESPQEGTAGTEPRAPVVMSCNVKTRSLGTRLAPVHCRNGPVSTVEIPGL
jgi:hypothetical protein